MQQEKKDAYIRKYRAQIDQWEAEIENLKTKAAVMAADVQVGYEKRLEDLQRKTREQGRKLDELQKASEDAWETLKRGFESTWTDVQSAWKDTKANLS